MGLCYKPSTFLGIKIISVKKARKEEILAFVKFARQDKEQENMVSR